jgi:hypothetical protein
MGRSDERRRAVRIAACLVDLKECIRAETIAEKEGKRPPMQPTGGRNRYVTLKPPKPRPKPGADEGGAGGAGAEGDANADADGAVLSEEEAQLRWMKPGKEPRIGANYQATRLPPYAPRCVQAERACVCVCPFCVFSVLGFVR